MSMLGQHHSPETKAKMSLAQLGKKHSDERRRNESLSHIGKKHSAGTRAKMSESRIGAKNHMFGKHNSEEAKAKMSLAHQGKILSEEHKANIGLGLVGNVNSTGSSNHNTPHSDEAKAKISAVNRVTMLGKWSDPDFKDERVRAIIRGNHIRPNIPEQKLQALLDELYPGEWKYTGGGEVIIGGRNPDFWNVNGQKTCLELFGSYWHRGEDPQDRIVHYAGYGFRCLVIWERELEDMELLTEKIITFAS